MKNESDISHTYSRLRGIVCDIGHAAKDYRMFMGEEPRQQQRPQSTHREKGGLNTSSAKTKKKVISKDEGEYVDYEEIK